MEENRPGYYAIIPADVRYDDNIPANAKLLYGEVAALIGKDGYCFASNQYFADVFGFSLTTVTRLLTQLEKGGYIIRKVIKDKEGKVELRKIYLSVSIPRIQPPTNFEGTPLQNCGEGTIKIGGDTNTSITVKENKKEKPKAPPAPELSDGDIQQLCVSWINEIAPESWGSFIKNSLYTSLIRFYAPRVKAKECPKRSKVGFDALCSKLLRLSEGQPDAMMDMLDTATTSGWKSVYPPNGQPKKAFASQPAGEENVKWI